MTILERAPPWIRQLSECRVARIELEDLRGDVAPTYVSGFNLIINHLKAIVSETNLREYPAWKATETEEGFQI